MKLADVEKIVATLPGATVGVKWNRRTWLVNDRGFAWERPLGKADLERLRDAGTPAPTGEILAVSVENLDAKDALLAMDLPGFFTIEHFNGYAAVLVELRKARAKDARAAVREAFGVMLARGPAKRRGKAKPRAKPAKRRAKAR